MNTKTIAFWQDNLNPITMRSKDTNLLLVVKKEVVDIPINVLNENLMNFDDCREYLGIGAKKIKSYAIQLGETPIKSRIGTLYKKETIEEIKKLIISKNNKKEEPTEDYISNPELMEMFNFSPFKAWDITRKHKLKKTTFKGKTIYFERDKAIEAFSKYQK